MNQVLAEYKKLESTKRVLVSAVKSSSDNINLIIKAKKLLGFVFKTDVKKSLMLQVTSNI